MEIALMGSIPVGQDLFEHTVAAQFTPVEAKQIMAVKDLFAGTGIPLDPVVELGGVKVRIDTPLQMSGLMIADEDLSARFTCSSEARSRVLRALDAHLREKLAPIWSKRVP